MATKKVLSTGEVRTALDKRYEGDAWALFHEVRNGTGYSRQARTADALAMSLWPSRGLELIGHEIKVSRSDWLHELKRPAKAEEICRFCDRWWLVVGDADIVKEGELPPTWGLLVPKGKKSLRIKVEAPKLEPEPISKLFLASLMRSMAQFKPTDEHLEAKIAEAHAEGVKSGEAKAKRELKFDEAEKTQLKCDNEALRRAINEFQAASGVMIRKYQLGDVGEAFGAFMRARNSAKAIVVNGTNAADTLDASLKTMRGWLDEFAQKSGLGIEATL